MKRGFCILEVTELGEQEQIGCFCQTFASSLKFKRETKVMHVCVAVGKYIRCCRMAFPFFRHRNIYCNSANLTYFKFGYLLLHQLQLNLFHFRLFNLQRVQISQVLHILFEISFIRLLQKAESYQSGQWHIKNKMYSLLKCTKMFSFGPLDFAPFGRFMP